MNFQYASGIPGYGTQGNDGSIGLGGLSFFYSSLSGAADKATLLTQIQGNYTLDNASTTKLAGYPSRTYQTGDLFLDTARQIWAMNVSNGNADFATTSLTFDSSTIFSSTYAATGDTLMRYRNVTQFALDQVSSISPNTTGLYADRPLSVYDVSIMQFNRIFFVDYLAPKYGTSANKYNAFDLWVGSKPGVETPDASTSIGLVRDISQNMFRWGNLQSGLPTDVYLSLDFRKVNFAQDVSISKILSVGASCNIINASVGSFSSSILFSATPNVDRYVQINTTTSAVTKDLYIQSQTTTFGGLGDVAIGGNLFLYSGDSTNVPGNTAGNIIISAKSTTTQAGNTYIYNQGDSTYHGDVFIGCSSTASYGQAIFGTGSATVPSITFRNDTNTGFYDASDNIGIITAGTKRFSIDASGLHSNGTTTGTKIYNGNGTASAPAYTFVANTSIGFYYTSATQLSVAIGGIEQFRFDSSTFYAKGDIIGFSSMPSDIRLKTNIKSLSNSLEFIDKLNPVAFEFKELCKGTHYGFIAQEVEEVMPSLVGYHEMLGKPDGELYKTLKYTEFIPFLVQAVQELRSENEYLKSEIETIKKHIYGQTN